MSLAAIVLAAGSATRFGSDKLSAPFLGEPLVRHAIRIALAAPVEKVAVICGPDLDIGDWAGSIPVERIEIASRSLSDTLKAGIACVTGAEGAFVFLGDMPLVPPDMAGRLADVVGNPFAVVPRCMNRPGHPVLLCARAFALIGDLSGDQGAGKLLRERDDVVWIDTDDRRVLLDIDRPGDLARLETQVRSAT